MSAQALDSGAETGGTQAEGDAGGRRLVLLLPGHDPTDMGYHHGRFAYQAGLFGKLWNCRVDVSGRLDDGVETSARWHIDAEGPNWRQQTDYEILRWDDIVVAFDERPDIVRLSRGVAALIDFLITGTAWRYFRACIRYGLFFLFPLAVILLFAAAGVLAGGLAGSLFASLPGMLQGQLFLPALSELLPKLVALVVGIAAFLILFRWPGRRWRLHQSLDDWDLARAYMYGRMPELEERLERFAALVAARLDSGRYDEVLLVGHSLGATLVLGVLERLAVRMPEAGRAGTRLCLLTCGATIPKLALHPAGAGVREAASRIAALPGLSWIEYQARHDAINFYKFDPVRLCRAGLDEPAGARRPLLRNANIKSMLSYEKLRRLRWEMMRLHYQFLLANEKRAAYDYFMFALGPVPFAVIAAGLGGAPAHFAADGSLLPQTAPVAAS